MFFRKKDMHRKLLVVLTNFIWKFENLETFKWCIKIAFPDAFHERNLDSCSIEEVKVFMPSPWSVKRTTPLSFDVEFICKNSIVSLLMKLPGGIRSLTSPFVSFSAHDSSLPSSLAHPSQKKERKKKNAQQFIIRQTVRWKWRHNEVFVRVFFDFIDNDFTSKTHTKIHVLVLRTRVCIQQTMYRCWF